MVHIVHFAEQFYIIAPDRKFSLCVFNGNIGKAHFFRLRLDIINIKTLGYFLSHAGFLSRLDLSLVLTPKTEK